MPEITMNGNRMLVRMISVPSTPIPSSNIAKPLENRMFSTTRPPSSRDKKGNALAIKNSINAVKYRAKLRFNESGI
jgi:hypothetical protein